MLEFSKREAEDLFHLACKNGQVTLIKNLLKAKVDINALDTEGLSSLHWAAIIGNAEVTKLLISEGANIEIKGTIFKSSPLLFACQNGRTKIVETLLENGADINAKSSNGTRAIHFAAQSGKTEIVKILLQKGLDINCKNDDGETPLYYAMYVRYFPLGCKATHALKMTKFLIKSGAKIDEATVSKETPLTHAITKANVGVVKLLISYGANVNRIRDSDSTPLHYAARCYHRKTEIIKILIDNGADVNALYKNLKISALHYVAASCSSKAVKLLLESGADPEMRNVLGLTPFDIALRCRNHKFVKRNLEFYPNFVADLSRSRISPIQHALERNNKSAFKMIITHCHKYVHQ